MTLSRETLAPLVGKTVTVTRNDIPGVTVGVLADLFEDCISIDHGGGKGQIIALKWVRHVGLSGPEGSYGPDYIPPGMSVPLCSSCGEHHHSIAGCRGAVGEPVPTPSLREEAINCLMRVYRETHGTKALSKDTTQTIERLITQSLMRVDRRDQEQV